MWWSPNRVKRSRGLSFRLFPSPLGAQAGAPHR